MAFPAPAEHDNMGEARAPTLSCAMIVLPLRAPLSGKERIRGNRAVCARGWVELRRGFPATSDAGRRVRKRLNEMETH